MVRMRTLGVLGIVAVCVVGLSGCPSQFLARIQEEIARAPFTASTYAFVRQWGNPHPEYSFTSPIVKADKVGYVYVADSSFRIRKFNAAGQLQKTFSLVAAAAFGTIYDMAFDAAGNMFVTNNSNQVQKYDVSGNLLLSWGSSGTGNGQFRNPKGIAVDSSGNIYVVDSTNLRIQKFDSTGAYVDQWTGLGKDNNAASVAFSSPNGMCIDKNGYVYVADAGNNRIVIFSSANGYFSSQWQKSGGGAGTGLGEFSWPTGIFVDSSNPQNFFVADSSNTRIQKRTSGGIWTAWSTGSTPTTVAVDTSGNVYVSDNATSYAGRVQKFDGTGVLQASWGGANGTANGIVACPGGVAFDSAGNSYVVDSMNSRIEKFDSTGNCLLVWGSAGAGNGQFSFNGPATIAVDASGRVYVPDTGHHRIQVFDSAGNYLNQWGSVGTTDGLLKNPTGVALDGAGNIYVADMSNYRIQVFDSNGYFLRKWGSSGAGDGQFQSIYGIAVDKSGNVYVSDMGTTNNRIQKFDSNGNLLAKWGTPGSGNGQFSYPVGIGADSIGQVYVCDMGNRRVQRFDSAGNFKAAWGSVGVGNGTFGWPVGVAVNAAGHVVVTDYTNSLVQEFAPAD
jgi:tripartite motif-containing protein 71